MSTVAKIVVLIVSLIALAAGAFLLFFDANHLRGTIQSQLEAGLKRKVVLGQLHLGLFPPALRIEDVAVGENPALLAAKQLDVRVALLPLLSKKVGIQSLSLTEPTVELIETAPGHWNYETPGEAQQSNTPFSIAELLITNGRVAITAQGKPRQVYEHIDLRLLNFTPGQPFNAEATLQLPQNLSLKTALKGQQIPGGLKLESLVADLGKLHMTGSGQWSAADTNLSLKIDRSSIADLAQAAASLGIAFNPGAQVTGNINADLRIAGPSATLIYSGIVELASLEVREPGWQQPVRIPAVRLDIAPHEIRTNTFTVESGTTKLTASALLNEYASPDADYQASIRAPSANLGELLQIASLYGGASTKGITASGKASFDVTLRGKLAKNSPLNFAGNATLDGASIRTAGDAKPVEIESAALQFSGANAATGNLTITRLTNDGLVLRNIRTTVAAKAGVITLDPLSADVAGGHQVGSLTIDTRGATPTYALRTKMDRADANQVLSATTSLKQKIFGLLTAQGDLRFAPKPGQDPASALNGTFGLNLTDGKLAGVNLVNEMAGVAKLLGFRKQGDAVTNILALTGNWNINNGLAETRDLKMSFDGGSLAAAGTVNLATQAIQMKLTTTMGRGFTDQFTGSKIGGLLTTALTNKNGEIIIPTIVAGTLGKPVFTPDAAEMARLRVQGVVPNAPEAIQNIGGAIDAIRKGGAKGVLDIFKKKQ